MNTTSQEAAKNEGSWQKLSDDLFQKVFCQNDGCKELAEFYANDGTLDAICEKHLR